MHFSETSGSAPLQTAGDLLILEPRRHTPDTCNKTPIKPNPALTLPIFPHPNLVYLRSGVGPRILFVQDSVDHVGQCHDHLRPFQPQSRVPSGEQKAYVCCDRARLQMRARREGGEGRVRRRRHS